MMLCLHKGWLLASNKHNNKPRIRYTMSMFKADGYVQNYIKSVTARASARTMHLSCHHPQVLLQHLINQLNHSASSHHNQLTCC